MKFLTTSVIADTKRHQEKREIEFTDGYPETLLGKRSFDATLIIEITAAGNASELWDMEKPDADKALAARIIKALETIEI